MYEIHLRLHPATFSHLVSLGELKGFSLPSVVAFLIDKKYHELAEHNHVPLDDSPQYNYSLDDCPDFDFDDFDMFGGDFL